jgi:hypothetical protein
MCIVAQAERVQWIPLPVLISWVIYNRRPLTAVQLARDKRVRWGRWKKGTWALSARREKGKTNMRRVSRLEVVFLVN